jgi:shikimate kinase
MLLDLIDSLIFETFSYHADTLLVDFDKFVNNKYSKLIIIGYAGSGKTTTGEYLAKKYNCKFIDTDSHRQELNKMNPNFTKPERDKIRNIWCMNELTSPEKVIMGGVYMVKLYQNPEFHKLLTKASFIFLGKKYEDAVNDAVSRDSAKKDGVTKDQLIASYKLENDTIKDMIDFARKHRSKIKDSKVEKL